MTDAVAFEASDRDPSEDIYQAGTELMQELVNTGGGFMYDEEFEPNAVLSITMLIPFSKMISTRSHWVKKCSTVSEFLAVLLREESKKKVLSDLTEALSTLSGNKLK